MWGFWLRFWVALKGYWENSCSSIFLNPLSGNLSKWSKTLKTICRLLATNYLSVFDYFVWLALNGLKQRHKFNKKDYVQSVYLKIVQSLTKQLLCKTPMCGRILKGLTENGSSVSRCSYCDLQSHLFVRINKRFHKNQICLKPTDLRFQGLFIENKDMHSVKRKKAKKVQHNTLFLGKGIACECCT